MKTNLLLAGFLLAAVAAPAATLYVDAGSTNPIAPYTNWPTAAAVIQDAVDAAAAGDEIVVTNGLYSTGGRPAIGLQLTNRVAVDRAVTVRSANGPLVTTIQGAYHGGGFTNGPRAVRCVYLSDRAVLIGFTLTHGATSLPGDETYGGGVWCQSSSAVISNCIIVRNSGHTASGVCRGTLNHCIISSNTTEGAGGGAWYANLNDCVLSNNWASTIGGGSYFGTLNNCQIVGNWAFGGGGGSYCGTLNNCQIAGNSTSLDGGGAQGSTLNNCTLTGNQTLYQDGGGAATCTLNNCIVYGNTAASHPSSNYYVCNLNYCCAAPMPTNGVGNITNEPAFVDLADGNLRLQSNSPCINAGTNVYVTNSTDLDGRPRLVGGRVDIGAYEVQDEFIAWLARYSLPTDGTADFTDPDGDGFNNYQEYRCGTDPTNALSALRLLPPAPAGTNLTLSWLSATGRSYVLECSTNLGAKPPFFPLTTNLPGQPGTTSFTVTNAAAWGPNFYRVLVP